MKNKKLTEQKTIFTTAELAKRWGMSPHTLKKWRVQKRGPTFVKFGSARTSKIVYRLKDIQAYENEHLMIINS